MRSSLAWSSVIVLLATAVAHAAPKSDFGLILNLDGDNAFDGETLEESTAILRAEIDGYADANVNTIAYSTGQGSEILLYPTKVGDHYGWRKTKYDDDPKWKDRIARNARNMQAGGDALRTVATQAKARGMKFVPSQRMNDGHFAFGKPPEDYPLTGRFWTENRDLEIKDSPIEARKEYGHLLDFTHEKVRNYRIAIAAECIERYADVMDGYELDFTRFQVFFPKGKADAGAPLMTDLVRQVRAKLDAAAKAQGRPLPLIVRMPPSPANCKWAGLEIEKWIADGLVDVVVPSQMMTMGFEQPIGEFKAMARGTDVQVYSGLLPRTGWSWDLTPKVTPGKLGTPDRAMTLPQLRGVVANAYGQGADGIYLFNYGAIYGRIGNPAKTPAAKGINLADRSSLAGKDEVFSITKAYWYDFEGGYEYRKQVPVAMKSDEPATFRLLVGAADAAAAKQRVLRLGFRELPDAGTISVSVNGKPALPETPITQAAVATFDPANTKVAPIVKAQKDLAQRVVQLDLPADIEVRQGKNEIVVELKNLPAAKVPTTLTDVDLGLFR